MLGMRTLVCLTCGCDNFPLGDVLGSREVCEVEEDVGGLMEGVVRVLCVLIGGSIERCSSLYWFLQNHVTVFLKLNAPWNCSIIV